jgi:hypothetical protein
MKPELKGYYSSDPGFEDLSSYVVPEDGDFSCLLTLLIGRDDSEGADEFYVRVCTPAWLTQHLRETKEGLLDGQHHLFVTRADIALVTGYIKKRLAALQGDDWQLLARQIDTFARWEYA